MHPGPLMLDLPGTRLSAEDRERLEHPMAGGVILFSRNFESKRQLTELVAALHKVRRPELLVAVDHEGGRVQRFRDGFTAVPAAGVLGQDYGVDPARACALARAAGLVMAAELVAVGIDFSFAPVLDLGLGVSEVIGDRAFHGDPLAVVALAGAYIEGMGQAGMAATGKHFPGHGSVPEDSHVAVPVDNRAYGAIAALDLVPFEKLVPRLRGIMPAHVIYPQADPQPAGFSRFWIEEVLRRRLGFEGTVFSDDLSMEGARGFGGMPERAEAAMAAGCDMVLVCNDRKGADQVLDGLRAPDSAARQERLRAMRRGAGLPSLEGNAAYVAARATLDQVA